MLRTTTLIGVLMVLCLGRPESALADSSWLPSWLGGKSDEVASHKSKSSHSSRSKSASSKKSTNLFASTKDLFKPKKKKRVVSKFPSDHVPVSHKHDDRSWFSRWFLPAEPEPPRSVSEWMELEQIKP